MYRVLLADDEAMPLLATERSLPWQAYGLQVTARTQDPVVAQKMLAQQRFDSAFLDIRMPGLSGLDIIRESVQNGSHTKFVLVTGYSEFEYAREAIGYGVVDFCLKPIEMTGAPKLLERLCREISAVREQTDAPLFEQLKQTADPTALCRWLGLDVDAPFWQAGIIYGHKQQLLQPLFSEQEITLFPEKNIALKLYASARQSAPACTAQNLSGAWCEFSSLSMLSFALLSLQSAASPGLPLERVHTGQGASGQNQFPELLQYIQNNICEPMNLGDIAQRFSFNYTYCSELFKKNLGVSFVQYLTQLRLNSACQLLTQTDLPAAEIAQRCGFGDVRVFFSAFKKRFGSTPAQFRAQETGVSE